MTLWPLPVSFRDQDVPLLVFLKIFNQRHVDHTVYLMIMLSFMCKKFLQIQTNISIIIYIKVFMHSNESWIEDIFVKIFSYHSFSFN